VAEEKRRRESRKYFDSLVLTKDQFESPLKPSHLQFFTSYMVAVEESDLLPITHSSLHLILDAGCGNGHDTIQVAKRCNAFTIGIDLSFNSVKLAKSKAKIGNVHERTEFIVGDVERLPFRPKMFDAILIIGLLHHLKSTRALIRLSQAVKRGGIMILREVVSNSPFCFFYNKAPVLLPSLLRKHFPEVGPSGEIPEVFLRPTSFYRNLLKTLNLRMIKEEAEFLYVFFLSDIFILVPWMQSLVPPYILPKLWRVERDLLKRTPTKSLCRLIRFVCIRQ